MLRPYYNYMIVAPMPDPKIEQPPPPRPDPPAPGQPGIHFINIGGLRVGTFDPEEMIDQMVNDAVESVTHEGINKEPPKPDDPKLVGEEAFPGLLRGLVVAVGTMVSEIEEGDTILYQHRDETHTHYANHFRINDHLILINAMYVVAYDKGEGK